MKKISICSIVTKDAWIEYEYLKMSLEMFHDCQWYIAADSYVMKKTKNVTNISAYKLIDDKKFIHGVKDVRSNQDFFDMLVTKFEIIKMALKKEPYIIFLDTDMIFVNKIEQSVLDIVKNKEVDVVLTPHYTRDKENEDRVGFYNAGMFLVNNIELINAWEKKCIEEESNYYEQPPLEEIVECYKVLSLPINYNIGWWRFKDNFGQFRYQLLSVKNNNITIDTLPAVNFHLHTIKKLTYPNFGLPLFNKLCELTKIMGEDSNAYKIINKIKKDMDTVNTEIESR